MSKPIRKRSYTANAQSISAVCINVRDTQVDVSASVDEGVYIDYYDSDKERYELSVSEDGVLTMDTVTNKVWSDYIGGKAPAEVRRISLQIPVALLHDLTVSTTNASITMAALTLNGTVSLRANGGDISFDTLEVGKELSVDVKNGNITGALNGSYDEYAISCSIKKGVSNLPSHKDSGEKKLSVIANNGNVVIEIGNGNE